ncbi:MAG: nuclear transport factor 2 family protein [Ginsengibacter sp.]
MKKITILFLLAVAFCILQGCLDKTKKVNSISDKEQVIKTEEAFSDMSRRQGMKKAFIEFMDDDGILLRPYHTPIVGADAIDFISGANDTSYKLTWKPSATEISSSGDLGFTYGIYLLNLPDTILTGTYVRVWKKQPDGKWKFTLDTGNEGIHADTLSP